MTFSPYFLPSVGAALFIAVHYLFLRAASGKISDTLGALVLEGTAALGIAVSYVVRAAFGDARGGVETSRLGLVFSVSSGLAITGASILLFTALRRGGPVAATGTIAMGGGMALSALLAPWIFQEGFTLRRAIGVGLGIAAIAVLSREGS